MGVLPKGFSDSSSTPDCESSDDAAPFDSPSTAATAATPGCCSVDMPSLGASLSARCEAFSALVAPTMETPSALTAASFSMKFAATTFRRSPAT